MTNGRTNGWRDIWIDGPMDGHCKNGLAIFLSYSDAIDVTENDDFPTDIVFFFFTKALPTIGPTLVQRCDSCI